MNTPEELESVDDQFQEAWHTLQAETRSLRQQLVALVIMVLVINVSLNLFLWRQLSTIRAQNHKLYVEYQEYRKKTAEPMNMTVDRLREFALTHPDYQAILSKFIKITNPAFQLPASGSASNQPTATVPLQKSQ